MKWSFLLLFACLALSACGSMCWNAYDVMMHSDCGINEVMP